jgi:formate dehydrogenase iron-sulfur subunit
MSDVCKHCQHASCMDVCPTGAIIRTEFDSVFVQPDVCNGCGYCVTGCPFGVINRRHDDGRVWKCTLCYDRQKVGMEPACAKACPTDSIVFGEIAELREKAQARVEQLHERGMQEAYLYGADAASQPGTGGLNAFFLLVDKPEVYNLPPTPAAPAKTVEQSWRAMAFAGLGMVMVAAFSVLSARGSRP